MLMPRFFERDLFDDLFDGAFPRMAASGFQGSGMMRTDIRENGEGFALEIDLPGVKKENVRASVKDGCLTVTASLEEAKDEEKGRYLRKERMQGNFSRTFYVGDTVTEEDIRAKFENGVLSLFVPKKEALPPKDETKYIAIA